MSQAQKSVIAGIVKKYDKARHRLMDIAGDVQAQYGCISDESAKTIADELGIPFIEVIDMISFYYFLSREPKGKSVIRLSDSVVDRMSGNREVAKAFEKAAGIPFGGTTADGAITLEYTSDIGMCDQAPAALVNSTVMTKLCPEDVPKIVERLKKGKSPGVEAKDEARPDAQVDLNLIQPGPVIFSPVERGAAVRAMANLSPEEVIDTVTQSGLRGRGGAGFPTGMKWSFCRKAKGDRHFVICNADEGEPGTFKDRVVLTEVPDLLFAGMTIAGYAIGADEGLLYLRGEYAYLLNYLEQVLARRRHLGLLGENIAGREGFNFDIRIQMGAGAYVCGEESSLIESLEGKRGAPRDRPPFPVTKGYMNQPSAVNNVETLCCVARIMEKGADWFKAIGTKDSTGTKLLSVSGDCKHPGVYEVEFGLLVDELLELVGAGDTQAVQIGGPSGSCIAPKDFGRKICFEDLPTGGSVIVFNKDRDLLEVVREFTEFFIEESCGWCAPCRVGTTLLKRMLEKVTEGRGTKADLAELENIGETIKAMSRCGLGQTAANPVLTTLKNMPEIYRARLKAEEFVPSFQIDKALADGVAIAGREPVWEEEL